ncbi:MAG: hypothetical protein KZQ66_10140, partial [Candidatus Thiodiazotropha sp. (ex Lucinoma aequizonata)]|nr:hypothetical protein [Candidatus Thiodiazotropha sp. (ex Lucinoma aequizonata)]MCU7897690.1 hypothetical protein [Candidatus Thiodiazotropha sp. (ex Lucinoma aequizonata)]MCU7902302.1 hypothetical protein [Candidatus Thiodiazotropha sp. (ex Lucinoma aequizonata)]MCU7908054.1 hypothetical protein [Candidatus Thiodiazotropha sp. (ex Lucinoma aequizonata)]MCU7912573.1 hypothetical protein [Candidatus Thiodiazotropha sp. (ex Lucinoma aequizonata)]
SACIDNEARYNQARQYGFSEKMSFLPGTNYRNDSTASRMRSLYALHLSLSVAIPAIQPRLRLSGTNRLRSAFHGGQRGMWPVKAAMDRPMPSSLMHWHR